MGKCHHGHGVGGQTRLLETACRNASEQAGVDTKVEQVKHSRGNGSGEVAQSEVIHRTAPLEHSPVRQELV